MTAEELYAACSALEPEQVAALLEQIREQAWQFLAPGEREDFLREHLSGDIVTPMESCCVTSGQGATGFWGTCCWMWSGKTAWKPAASSTGQGTRSRWRKCWKATKTKRPRCPYREAAARGCRQYLERHIQPSWRCSAPRRWENGASCGTCCWTRFWPPPERRSAVIDERAEFAAYTGRWCTTPRTSRTAPTWGGSPSTPCFAGRGCSVS